MYVCVCNAITCRTVRKTVEEGAASVGGVFKAAGKKPQCGRCFPMVRSMIADHAPACAGHDDIDSGLAIAAE